MVSSGLFLYDRTFDGLLTAVFDAFVRKTFPSVLQSEDEPLPLFHDEVFTVVTDKEKAGRVWRALEKKLSKQAKNSDVNIFAQNIFLKVFEKIAQNCYVQQMDAFAKLFEEPSFYSKVMEEMGRAMYFNLKNGSNE